MILSVILILAGIAALASVINLFEKKKNSGVIPMEVQLPGNLPIIALSNGNGVVFNFLLDSGSNISHICSEYLDLLDCEVLGTYKEGSVQGLGANNIGVTVCATTLKDVLGNTYSVNLSISDHLKAVSDSIEENTGIRVHGLLGTDFLKTYNYVLNFKELEVYPMKQ